MFSRGVAKRLQSIIEDRENRFVWGEENEY